jgi:hypothetical protein
MKIRDALDSTDDNDIAAFPLVKSAPPMEALSSFVKVSVEEVAKIVKSSPSKQCSLDPIPTWLLKDLLDILASPITFIVNLSLTSGTVPSDMKHALVRPLLKKASLDRDLLKNYRPVSNLSFVSKVVEKAVDKQVSKHLTTHNLYAPMQSAYRPKHSVETALVRVHNDFMQAMDSSQGIILVLLDLSAAFDTIDHDILLHRLEQEVGITDSALGWFESYLGDRFQSICINGQKSKPVLLQHGVPQGSVGGPKDFTMYTPLINIIANMYGVSVHLYADDTQLYVSFNLDSPDSMKHAISKLEECIAHIAAWMKANKLQLNAEKTEAIIVCHPQHRHKLQHRTITIGNTSVVPSSSVRNLGAIFDHNMSMADQITAICRSLNFQLRSIGRIRKFLTRKSAETIVHSVITSRLDTNNALLQGISKTQLDKLSRVQRTAARVVTCTKKYTRINILNELHWLPVAQRISFKILVLVFKSLNGLGPQYLTELLDAYVPTRSLRSKDQLLLLIPKTRLITAGDRAFRVAGPKLWNVLPNDVRSAKSLVTFKSKLKSYLFKQAKRDNDL